MPKRYLNAVLDRDFPEQAKTFSLESSYYIHGPIGTGKTHLLCSMLREHIGNCSCRYIDVGTMLELIKGSYNSPRIVMDEDEEESKQDNALSYFQDIPVLALDDLGSERLTDWSLSTIKSLLNHRYNEMLITLITSNLSLDELSKELDVRVSSRLAQMCKIIQLTGQDRRQIHNG